MSDPTEKPARVGTVAKASGLLGLLSEGPRCQTLTELASKSGMPLSILHRLLRAMVEAGWVEQHPEFRTYSLGAELVRLSTSYVSRHPVVRALAPYLAQTRDATRATILVSLLIRHWVVYTDQVASLEDDGLRASERTWEAFETAAGRLLLARAPVADWDAAVKATQAEGQQRETVRSSTFTAWHRKNWARRAHLALANVPLPAYTELAVPVPGPDRRTAVALSALSHADDEAEREHIVRLLQQTASAATGNL